MGKIFFKKFPTFAGMLGHLKKVSRINFGPIQQFYASLKIGKITENPKSTLGGHFLRDLTRLQLFWEKIQGRSIYQKKPRFTDQCIGPILSQNCNWKFPKFEIENTWVRKKVENLDFSTQSRTQIEKPIFFLDAPSKTAYQIPNFQIRKVKILGYPRSEMRVGQSLYISIKEC